MLDEHAHNRIDAVEKKLEIHGEQINKLIETNDMQTIEIKENTRITQEVADNTKEVVELLKGGRVLGKLVIWLAATGAAITTLVSYFKGGH